MTFRHRAGVSPYTSPYGFAETCVFGKQSLGPFHCDHTCVWHRFSRSYAVILPSSLTMVIPSILQFSCRAPVSVCGTGSLLLLSRFSRQCGFMHYLSLSIPAYTTPMCRAYFTTQRPYVCATAFHLHGCTILLCPCIGLYRNTQVKEYQPFIHRLPLSDSP